MESPETYKVGDKVKWNGMFVGKRYLSGTNTIKKIFNDVGFRMVKLDNNKEFIIQNLKHPTKKVSGLWNQELADKYEK